MGHAPPETDKTQKTGPEPPGLRASSGVAPAARPAEDPTGRPTSAGPECHQDRIHVPPPQKNRPGKFCTRPKKQTPEEPAEPPHRKPLNGAPLMWLGLAVSAAEVRLPVISCVAGRIPASPQAGSALQTKQLNDRTLSGTSSTISRTIIFY